MSEGFHGSPPGDGPESQPLSTPPPPRKSSAGKIILILAGVGGVLMLLCCGGFGLLGYLGLNKIGDVVQREIQDEPAVQQHIGQIEKCSFNMMATGELAEETGDQGVLVFDLSGSKGSGQLHARVVGDRVTDATLELPSGETVPLSQ